MKSDNLLASPKDALKTVEGLHTTWYHCLPCDNVEHSVLHVAMDKSNWIE
jgi:hypothetical protein